MTTDTLEAPEQLLATIPVAQPVPAPIVLTITEATIEKRRAYLEYRIKGVDDKEGLARVRSARMDCVHDREDAKREAKAQNAFWKEQIGKVDERRDRLLALLEPIETHLSLEQSRIELEIDRIAREKAEAVYQERLAKLAPVWKFDPMMEPVIRGWSDEEFAVQLAAVTKAHEERVAEAARAKAEEEERQRVAALEEERLKTLVAERTVRLKAVGGIPVEYALRTLTDAEFEAELNRIIAHKEESSRQKIESDRLAAQQVELDRKRAEQETVDRQQREAQAKIDAENRRLAKEREDALCKSRFLKLAEVVGTPSAKTIPEASLRKLTDEEFDRQLAALAQTQKDAAEKARVETEERVRRQNEAAEKRRQEEEEAKARELALRPDREKLKGVATALLLLEIPDVSEAAQEAKRKVMSVLELAVERINEIAAGVK